MARVGIKKIGIVETNDIDDQWVVAQQEEPAARGLSAIDHIHLFKSPDQSASSLAEELVVDEQGRKYAQRLETVVRTDSDITMAVKYAARPVVVHVWTVGGRHIAMGTRQYPATMVTSDRNSGQTREVSITVDYETLSSLLQ